jgi:hypothetical protein
MATDGGTHGVFTARDMALRFSQPQVQLMLYESTKLPEDKERSLKIPLDLQHRLADLIYQLEKDSPRG